MEEKTESKFNNIINEYKNLSNEDRELCLRELSKEGKTIYTMKTISSSCYRDYRAQYYKDRYKNDEEFRNKMKKKSNENYRKKKEKKNNE